MAKRLPESAFGWFVAVWTLAVAAALIVGEVWNALNWTAGGGGMIAPSSKAVAVLTAVFAFVIWPVGLLLGLLLLVGVDRLAHRIGDRIGEVRRSRRNP